MYNCKFEPSEGPLYYDLYKRIKEDIESGNLVSGEKLPSKRNLAKALGISIITVQNAYQQLSGEGYIFSKEKSGYFVSSITLSQCRFSASEGQASPEIPEYADKAADADGNDGKIKIDLCRNVIDRGCFPYSVWAKLLKASLNNNEKNEFLLKKIPGEGIFALRKAIADFLLRFRQMRVSPEQIVIGAGTEYLYSLIIKLLGRGKIYAVEDPGYKTIASVYQLENVKCRFIALDSSGLSQKKLAESGADIVHISPSHHFPTGIVMPVARRRELLSWAYSSPERYIIEDDYDSEFRYCGRPVPTLQSIDTSEKVIYINTFSKTISPSIRISYMVLPKSLTGKFNSELKFFSCTVSGLEQYALADFIESGAFENHISRIKSICKAKRDSFIGCINERLAGKAEISEQNSGLHFILRVHTEKSSAQLSALALRKGLMLSFVSDYCVNGTFKSGYPELIVNYSGIEPELIPEAVNILGEII